MERDQIPPEKLAEERMKLTPGEHSEGDEGFSSDGESSSWGSDVQEEKETKPESKDPSVSEKPQISEKKQENHHSRHREKRQRKEEEVSKVQFPVQIEHPIDSKYFRLMNDLIKWGLFSLKEISTNKEAVRPTLKSSRDMVIINAVSAMEAERYVEDISDWVDGLNMFKVPCSRQMVFWVINFRLLRKHLKEKELVVFVGEHSKNRIELYIGGRKKMSQIKPESELLKRTHFLTIHMTAFRNTRNYRKLIDNIICSQTVRLALKEYRVEIAEVIKGGKTDANDRTPKIVMGTMGKSDKSFYEYEQFIMQQMSQWVTLSFCLKPSKYWPRLTVPSVIFDYSRFFQLGPRYLHIQATREDFTAHWQQIIGQLEQIGKEIYGVRFMKNMQPQETRFDFRGGDYFKQLYPKQSPYSLTVVLNKNIEDKKRTFDWRKVVREAAGMLEEVKDNSEQPLGEKVE